LALHSFPTRRSSDLMQCGTLASFCRNHNETGNIDQYVWSFGEAIEELSRQAISLRYRLLPYIYAAFMRAAETGEPVQKPLVFERSEEHTSELQSREN